MKIPATKITEEFLNNNQDGIERFNQFNEWNWSNENIERLYSVGAKLPEDYSLFSSLFIEGHFYFKNPSDIHISYYIGDEYYCLIFLENHIGIYYPGCPCDDDVEIPTKELTQEKLLEIKELMKL